MAIATITPQNRTQTNLLAQALNGSSGSLAQALNSAIQKSALDVKIQHQQNQNLVREQARNIQHDQEERFDLKNREERDRQYFSNEEERVFNRSQTMTNNEILNQGRMQNQDFAAENQNFLRNKHDYYLEDRKTKNALQIVEQQQEDEDRKRQIVEQQRADEDRKRRIEAGVDPTSLTIDKANRDRKTQEWKETGRVTQKEQQKAADENILKNNATLKQRNEYGENMSDDPTNASDAELRAGVTILMNSDYGKTPNGILKLETYKAALATVEDQATGGNRATGKNQANSMFTDPQTAFDFAIQIKNKHEEFDGSFGTGEFALGKTNEQFYTSLKAKGIPITKTDAYNLYDAEKYILESERGERTIDSQQGNQTMSQGDDAATQQQQPSTQQDGVSSTPVNRSVWDYEGVTKDDGKRDVLETPVENAADQLVSEGSKEDLEFLGTVSPEQFRKDFGHNYKTEDIAKRAVEKGFDLASVGHAWKPDNPELSSFLESQADAIISEIKDSSNTYIQSSKTEKIKKALVSKLMRQIRAVRHADIAKKNKERSSKVEESTRKTKESNKKTSDYLEQLIKE